ncbi:ATP-dependent DNA helicase, UvrD/REP family [Myxococcus xanthus DK 1622]|uniref:DNA 3'-5' helicase n=3 Tax=Myxococcus TaxID=32 RepID=Q1D937_MYXXD|nr:UvrD-helicase domain-containing protein [Myxococcus xanthus]ABF92294.1 ATP-dependent DNA helicase, UvrD/REP family [Myxococcus xanthus DK 1622]QPM82124.1 UvrD-helicase domain-containing protein [Myxococcus xanthus]QVW71372.1 UvrD-helicase domain-containing protein [Myxococcus xanthus DZ2]QZZ50342.1 ATP-dependent helicase/nuclease subunit A [Myxococcus xanthus]UEO02498.1 UvrD-helicase domain-containing protein [Myxococcus xanthus DZ2]
MSSEPSLFALERNLALMAGAGAGKTYSLVTMTLHLLAGARVAGGAVRPSRLCMLTFTDKAAAEMRSRVRQRLDGLAQGDTRLDQEVDLRESLARLDKPFPLPDAWRQLREELGAATVGTFHSLCGQLLRRAPPAVGIDPNFEVLDSLEATGLVQDVCERVVLDALEAGDAQVRELCQELGFSGSGFSDGLVAALMAVYGKLREEGLRAENAAVSDAAEARAELESSVTRCLELCAEARGLDAKGEWSRLLGGLERALNGMTPENFGQGERFPWLRACFKADGRNFARLSKGAAGPVREFYWRVFGKSDGSVPRLDDAWAAWRTAPFEVTFRELLTRVETRHDTELSRRNVLDFTSLLVKSRDLLRAHPEFRRQVQERIGALLVDEFQDTNRLQLELVLLLAEKREDGPRELAPDADLVTALPLEPAFLCAVGDRKQSIYEFRGADVSVFSVLAKKLVDEGGTRGFLQHNRRSVPGLLSFFNRTFAGVLVAADARAPRPFEVIYVPEQDDLAAVRPSLSETPVVERLQLEEADTAADLRWLDADAIARRLRCLLAPGAPASVAREDGEGLRPARGGDVAMLFRTFTHLEVYRQALIRHGVPHRVLRGRGFYGAQEVLDLASLLALLADAEDALAFAAVLRSPLVGLKDASLFLLAGDAPLSLSSPRLTDPEVLVSLSERERQRLERFLAALPGLRRERDRMGVRELLVAALDVTGYREALAGSPYAEQASANVEKLLALASRRDERGTGGCVAFSRELRMLAENNPTEAQADLLDASDPRAVQLLTIHSAKGLEWPVVVVPSMGGRRRGTSGRAHFERTHGISLRPWVPDSLDDYTSSRFDAVRAELKAREDAEYRRLLYVALTRAKDMLVLAGGAEPRGGKDSWWHLIDGRLEVDADLRDLVDELDVDTLPPPADPEPPGPEALLLAEARVEAALLRVRGQRVAQAESLGAAVASAEALQDFIACPRRFHYVHRLGLRGAPWPWEVLPRGAPPLVEPDGWLPAERPEDLVQRLLRGVDLRLAAPDVDASERRAHLETLLRDAGALPDEEGMDAVLNTLERFLTSAFARELARAPSQTIHRSLPFMLALEGEVGVEGAVDLLWESPQGEAVVVAFKHGGRHPLGAAAYTYELAALGLVARRMVREGVPVRVGVVFLKESQPEPEWLSGPRGLEEAAGRLAGAARAVARGEARGEWDGREKAACQALHCGFAEHCHPAPRAC